MAINVATLDAIVVHYCLASFSFGKLNTLEICNRAFSNTTESGKQRIKVFRINEVFP